MLLSTLNPKHLEKPIFAEYILFTLDELKNNWPEEHQRLAALFSPDIIEKLLSKEDDEVISYLLNYLPVEHFRSFEDQIVERILTWDENPASAGIQLLAKLNLEKFVAVCKRGEEFVTFPFFGILAALEPLAPHYGEEIFELISNAIMQAAKTDVKRVFAPKLFVLGCLYSIERHAEIVINFLKIIEDDEEKIPELFNRIYTRITGNAPYFRLIDDLTEWKNESLHNFAMLFREDAPLDAIEIAGQLSGADRLREAQKLISADRSANGSYSNQLKIFSELSQNFDAPFLQDYCGNFLFALILAEYQINESDVRNFSTEKLYDLLRLNIYDLPFIETIAARLGELPAETIIPKLIQMAKESHGSDVLLSIVKIMSILKFPEFIDTLIDSTGEVYDDYTQERASLALLAYQFEATKRIADRWNNLDSSQRIYCQQSLENYGGNAAQQIALNWAKTENNLDEPWFDLAMRNINPEIFKILEHEVRREQSFIDTAFYVSCCLLDISNPKLVEVEEREAERQLLRKIAIQNLSGSENDTLSSPELAALNLKLKCRKCSGVNTYQIKKIFLPDDTNHQGSDFFIPDQPKCASCDDETDFELTPDCRIAFAAETLKTRYLFEKEQYYSSPLVYLKDIILNDEKMPLKNVYPRYEELYQNHPNDMNIVLGYANTCWKFGKPKRAMELYGKSLELDRHCAEAVYGLAQIYLEIGLIDEANYMLEHSLPSMDDWNYYKLRRITEDEFKQAYLDLYDELQEALGYLPEKNDGPAYVQPPITHQHEHKSHKKKKRR